MGLCFVPGARDKRVNSTGAQGSGLCNIMSAGVRIVLYLECRGQVCIECRTQGLGVCNAESVGVMVV